MRILLTIATILFSLTITTYAQHHPVHVKTPVYFAKTPPLRDLGAILPECFKSGPDEVIEITKAPISENYSHLDDHQSDPVLQDEMGVRDPRSIFVNAEGVGNLQNKIPPDTEGDVGPNHYLQMINMSLAVFDKEGMLQFGPVANITLWQNAPGIWSEYSNGDPIVLYDEAADRWLISELAFPYHPYGPYYEKIAVSESGDPTGSWYLYGYEYDYFCDYPKIGVWHDGYYMTTNNNYWDGSQWHFHAVGVSVFERDSMLTGSPDARRIFFDLYPNNEPWSMLPADFDGLPPPDNTPAYLAYYKEGYPDRIGIFSLYANWTTPENSTIELSQTLYPEPFSGNLPDGIPQPEGAPYLSALSNRLLYRLQYRNFDTCQTLVTNHTVNKGNGVAGIRWYEFRNSGNGWNIFQQGTYSPDDTYRWMGSAAMDGYGNIALGYSVSGYNTYPSIRFTGRYKDDPPGEMTLQEMEIITGTGVQLSPYHRWGDYSCMSVDPVNHTIFWYTQQYYEVSGDKTWQTRIAAFNITDLLALGISAENDTVCNGDSVQLFALPTGGNGNYSFSWISDPDGFVSSEQNPSISPDTTTLFICIISDGVNQSSDSMEIYVLDNTIAYAGPDTQIMAGEACYIEDAIAEFYSSLKWTTTGDGIFNDSNYLHTSYIPGVNDILAGEAFLTITAFPYYNCDTVSDRMLLAIIPVTGINREEPDIPFVFVKPNPSGGTFELVLDNFNGEEIIFMIRQLSGAVIYQEVFKSNARQVRTVVMDRPGPGVYFAQLKTSSRNIILKLLIM